MYIPFFWQASKDEDEDDDEYEYIEEGPPEIIFKGNEIILRKNKVRVPKKTVAQVDVNEVFDYFLGEHTILECILIFV